MKTVYFRGHEIYWDSRDSRWHYFDNNELSGFGGFGGKLRPCRRKCGKTFEGSNIGEADPCLGELPGVDNACCGHGVRDLAYIRFTNGVVIKGFNIEGVVK